MEVVKQTKENTIYKKRSGRFGVKNATGKWVNGEEKVKVLLGAKLIKVDAPKKAEAKQSDADAEAADAPAEEAAAETEETPTEETPTEEVVEEAKEETPSPTWGDDSDPWADN